MNEVWKDVIGYEDFYQISNIGRVKRKSRYIEDKNKTQFIKEKILVNCDNGNGYEQTFFKIRNMGRKMQYVHRLVAKHFLDNYDETKQINHKDFNRKNNNVNNLEMLSVKENINYSVNNGRYINGIKISLEKKQQKYKEKQQKYTEIVIKKYKNGSTIESISKELNISLKIITKILNKNNIKTRKYKYNPIKGLKDGKEFLFDNINFASRFLINNNYTNSKYCRETISDVLNGKTKTDQAYGFRWLKV